MDTIIVWVLMSILIMVLWFAFIKKRSAKKKVDYPNDWNRYLLALEKKNIAEINEYGSKIIWNEFLEYEHRKKMFKDIEKLVSIHKELSQLWTDIHYVNKGIEPIL